jgi:dTDP-4-dehydrorhamnose 3,5-epimerase
MIDGITFTALDKIESDAGSVLHFIKNDDPGYIGFGEVYFSTVKKGAIKAWKMHKLMTLNLVVPVGEVLFVFVDQRKKSKTNGEIYKVRLSSNPYRRMTVPPGIWFGFMGLSSELNLLSNQADIVHDPNEVERKDLNAFQIDWSNL